MNTYIRRKIGISLIEIIIVILIACILLGIGIPYFLRFRVNTQLRTYANQLKADLDLARSIARKEGANSRLEYSLPRNASTSYQVKDSNGNVKKKVDFSGGAVADFSGLSAATVEFRANGSCTAGGNIVVRGDNTNKYFTLSITQISGAVKIIETN